MKYLIILCTLLCTLSLHAQKSSFSALVVNTENEPLVGATVNWQDTSIAAVTNADGWFTIPRIDTINTYILEINYVGYSTATVEILPEEQNLQLILENDANLELVEVESTQRSSSTSTLSTLNVENINSCELKRAACCNLSESFVNNGTVDVGMADAVTGTKEIEMLGLRGTYTQMMIENRPMFNRLGRIYGLEYIPGTWITGIQVSKGSSTVRLGSQSIAGQINTELIRPDKGEDFFINVFANNFGRAELNMHWNTKISENLSTGLLLHGNYMNQDWDLNKDGFIDLNKKRQINALSRWIFKNKDWFTEHNFQGIVDRKIGGQTENTRRQAWGDSSTAIPLYQIDNQVERIGYFGKLAYLSLNNPSQSIALIWDLHSHKHIGLFGNNNYTALQRRAYTNAIFTTQLSNDKHHLTTGLQYDYLYLRERYLDNHSLRNEHIIGAYAEYDYKVVLNEEKGSAFGIIAGLRADAFLQEKLQQIYPVPRLHLKYNFTSNSVIRLSAGRGVRMPNAYIENFRFFASNRTVDIQEDIRPETAWNYGINYTQNFVLAGKEGDISINMYRSDFQNQMISDPHTDHEKLQIYNLRGKSFSNSFLVSYTQDLVKGLEMRLAYKFNDVQTSFQGNLESMHLIPQHRGLVHLNYTTPKKNWQFSATAQYVGAQRLPELYLFSSDATLPDYRLENKSPGYILLSAHTNYYFKNGLEIYLGGENLGNYTQRSPILNAEDPFETKQNKSTHFDAASVYAPIWGMTIYGGIRYTFNQKD